MAQDSDSSSDDFSWLDSLFKSPPPVIPASEGLQSQYGPVGTEMLGPQQMGMPAPGGFDPVVNAGLLGLGGRPVTASRLATMQNTLGTTAGLGNADMGVAGTFAGPMARGANLAKMKLAQAMDRWGASPEMIRQQTGWDRNAANQWRYEIPDDQMSLKVGAVRPASMNSAGEDISYLPQSGYGTNRPGTKLQDIVSHPELFNAYPQLGNIDVRPELKPGNLGSFLPPQHPADPGLLQLAPQSRDSMLGTILHEMQHGVQDTEGFAGGSDPSWYSQLRMLDPGNKTLGSMQNASDYNLYHQTAGEVEARTTQDRRTLSAEDRKWGLPLDDVPRTSQINLLPDSTKTGTYLSLGKEQPNVGSQSIKVPVNEMMHPEYKEYLKQLVLSGYKAVSPRGSSVVEFKK